MRCSSIPRYLVALIVICSTTIGPAGEPQKKLDLELRLLSSGRGIKLEAMPYPKIVTGTSHTGNVRVLIRHKGSAQDLRDLGYHVTSQVGRIAAAVVPVNRLMQLAGLETVQYVESCKLMTALNDIAVPAVGGTAVRQKHGLTGKGVIVGIFDSGIDWRHEDFRKPNGKTRIKYILDFSDPGDPDGDGVLDGDGPYGGTLYTEAEINNALEGNGTVRQADRVGHGTHVTGCAAGDGLGSDAGVLDGTYAGVAPEADIIAVKSQYGDKGKADSFGAVNALAFFDEQATELGKPIVVNFSYGGHGGAHDGTGNDELAIDDFVGQDTPGRVVVVGAGNDGQDKIHMGGAIHGEAKIEFEIPDYAPKDGKYNDYVYFNIWYSGEKHLSIRLTSPSGWTYGPVGTSDERYGGETDDGGVYIFNEIDWKGYEFDPQNYDYIGHRAYIRIFDYSASKYPSEGTWIVTLTGSAVDYHLWLPPSFSSLGEDEQSKAARLIGGDTEYTVGIPGTSKSAITVGGWVSRKSWINIDGESISADLLVRGSAYDSSSIGPSSDGRTKPEICAPAIFVVSTLSANAWPGSAFSMWPDTLQTPGRLYVSRDGEHAAAAGTSVAAPLVAGGIALMLQQDPSANAAEIRDKLTNTATSDEFTGDVPNDKWGFGKVNFDKPSSSVQISGHVYRAYRPNEVLDESHPGLIAGATITWWNPVNDSPGAVFAECSSPVGSVTSDFEGNYEFSVPYGWSGRVVAAKLRSGVGEFQFTNVTSDQSLDTPLFYEPTLTLSGYVYEGNSWTGISGVTIQADGLYAVTAETDTNGYFSTDVPHGYYGCIWFSKWGYQSDYYSLNAITSDKTITFRLRR